jgi:hypothetical protein
MLNPEREAMAMLLTANAELVANQLRATDDADHASSIRALAATRSLSAIIEDTLRALVDEARGAGLSWAQIGGVLHVSRQAAFQRFGGNAPAPIDAEEHELVALPNAAELARPVLESFLDGEFTRMRANFDTRMLDAAPPELLASMLEKVRAEGGELLEIGVPQISVKLGYTVVTFPLAFSGGDAVSDVSLDADGQVAGFFIRRSES